MFMDLNGGACSLEIHECIQRSTDPQAIQPSEAYHPPDGCKTLHNRQYSQPIQQFEHSQSRKVKHVLLLP